MPLSRAVARKHLWYYHLSETLQLVNRSRLGMLTRCIHEQEFAEERKHVVRQHAAETQELSDIIAAVEVRRLGRVADVKHHRLVATATVGHSRTKSVHCVPCRTM